MPTHTILLSPFGSEYVSIELDDPFGSDPNDFNCLRMTYVSTVSALSWLESATQTFSSHEINSD